jgi:hypothetical protein
MGPSLAPTGRGEITPRWAHGRIDAFKGQIFQRAKTRQRFLDTKKSRTYGARDFQGAGLGARPFFLSEFND